MAQCLGTCSLRVRFGAPTSDLGFGSVRTSSFPDGLGHSLRLPQPQARPRRMVSLTPGVAAAALDTLLPLVDRAAIESGKEWPQLLALVADGGSADWLGNTLYSAGQNANSLVQGQLEGSLSPARTIMGMCFQFLVHQQSPFETSDVLLPDLQLKMNFLWCSRMIA